MSKSKKNIIDPEDIFSRYGADTARWFVLTDTPPDKDIEWTDSGIEAAYKFMSRIWTILSDISAQTDSHKQDFSQQDNKIRLLLKEYSHNLSLMIYNKALAKIYELFNFIQAETKQGFILSQSLKSEILVCLYPVIPFITTELWEIIGMAGTISDQKWPDYSHIKEEISEITIAVQILGKMRGTITVSADASQTDIEETVQNTPIFDKYINGKTIKKVIYVAGKIINYVVV